MKNLRTLFTLLFLSLTALTGWAEVEEGKAYYIVSALTGKVVTNGGQGARDVAIVTADRDAEARGQKWKLRSTSFGDGTYIIVSTDFPSFAIDVAPEKPGAQFYPVHWDANTGSANESFLIRAVEGRDNTYQILPDPLARRPDEGTPRGGERPAPHDRRRRGRSLLLRL